VETRGLIVQRRDFVLGTDVGPNWSKLRLVARMEAFQGPNSSGPSTDSNDQLFLLRNCDHKPLDPDQRDHALDVVG
jgi:hypothetical protein